MTATSVANAKSLTSTLRRQDVSFTVPYNRLFLSPGNVRSAAKRSPESVRALASMIDADGLLSDLHVTEERDGKGKPTGRFGVEAGGRRWLAIGVLIQAGKLAADVQVPCQKVDGERATGVSLAENISQEPMHAADEFAAFAKLIAQGKTPEAVAAHFGVKVIDVQRRMKLANVSPVLVAMFRDDKLTLDQMMAFASTDDHKRQLAVWKSLPEYSRTATSIKRRLTETEVLVTDPRVKFIGLDRYKASGGTIRTDLFSEQDYLEDAGLVDLIVSEVLAEAEARVQTEGWAWVEVFEEMGYAEREQFVSPPKKYLSETDAARVQREALEAKLEALETRMYACEEGDEEDEELQARYEVLDKECDAVRAQLTALEESRLDTTGFDKSALGAVVTCEAGTLKIMRGKMTAKDAKAEQRKQVVSRTGPAGELVAAVSTEFSEKLTLDLTSHRTAAVQAALTRDVPVALAVLASTLYGDVSRDHGSVAHISLKQCTGALEKDGTALADSVAAKFLEAQRARWADVVPEDRAERVSWLLRQPQETVLALLAFCTALSIDLTQRRQSPMPQADVIADALDLDMAAWWSVGVDNFLTQVSKAKIVAVVTEACDAAAAAPLAAMKKTEACAAAAALLVDSRWLPTPMRLGTARARSAAAANDGNAPGEANAA